MNIVANNSLATASLGMSGGDRIFLELARSLSKKGVRINLFTGKNIENLCKKARIDGLNFYLYSSRDFSVNKNLVLLLLLKLILGTKSALAYSHKDESTLLIYSSSDFWPDAIPALLMKLRNRKAMWIAAFYQFAPKPWQEDSPYKGKRFLTGFFFWLTQLPIYWVVKRYAGMVFVTSDPDVKKFVTRKRTADKIIVIRGGLDIRPSNEYLSSGKVTPVDERKYDAVFVGRFHPQKGIFELIDIWKMVCKRKPNAKLAIVGIGSLEDEIKEKIRRLGLKENIELLGFKDGEEKYKVFRDSKMVVHPATYDSGGMAAVEGMAWGLPGVSFDLEALRTYYPKGMLKTPCFDVEVFAANILRLSEDRSLYEKTKYEALEWAREWDWDKRAEEIIRQIETALLAGK